MKHVQAITKSPRRAQDLSLGTILTVISQIITVVAGFLSDKESAATE